MIPCLKNSCRALVILSLLGTCKASCAQSDLASKDGLQFELNSDEISYITVPKHGVTKIAKNNFTTIKGSNGGDTVALHGHFSPPHYPSPNGMTFLAGTGDDKITIDATGTISIGFKAGTDIISGASGKDGIRAQLRILIPPGISRTDLDMTVAPDKLGKDYFATHIILHSNLYGGSLDVHNYWLGQSHDRSLDIVFANGDVWRVLPDNQTFTATAQPVTRFEGTWGKDVMAGTANNDETFYGLGGDDTIYGNGGNDILYGGQGSDLLVGGKGDDDLFGGEDPTTFEFSASDGNDIVEDYGYLKGDLLFFDDKSISERDLQSKKSGDDFLLSYGTGTILLKALAGYGDPEMVSVRFYDGKLVVLHIGADGSIKTK